MPGVTLVRPGAFVQPRGIASGPMAGGIVLVLAMVIAVPVGVMLAGALWSAVFGWVSAGPPDPADGEATGS